MVILLTTANRFVLKQLPWLAVAVLLLLRISLAWYGFDRLPLITSNDEAILNDPAVALSRGQGLRAPSFEGTIIGGFYAHHPPIYTLLQAVFFRWGGITPLTLRGLGLASSLAALFALLYLLFRLWRHKACDRLAALAIASVCLAEPTTLSLARWGRMDGLAVFFCVLAFGLLLSRPPETAIPKAYWLLAAVSIGLGISTHMQVIVYWAAFLIYLYFNRKALALRLGLVVAAMPLAVTTLIWLLTYRDQVIEAFWQYRLLTKLLTNQGLSLGGIFQSLILGKMQEFTQVGGFAFVLVLLSWVALAIRLIIVALTPNNPQRAPQEWQRWFRMVCLFTITHLLFIHFLLGTSITRISVLFPLSMVGLGIAISHIAPHPRQWVAGGIAVLVGVELLLSGAYLTKIHQEWASRSPDRFDAVVESLASTERVAALPVFWFAFMKHQRPVRIIIADWSVDRQFWETHPHELSNYDAVILKEKHPLLNHPSIVNRSQRPIHLDGETYLLLERS